ncbi:nuclear transport factor 2 family protein [uncultured Aureimonas sp.]|uniref:nuclear transport factor 2 family protein n=1 Tax=uncultured Aureimonas sp. TaxID=1604662 RepID=UPI0025DD6DAC|nr:nuclear transport factor 2 family protein [uncultured Aureimonas sp.]
MLTLPQTIGDYFALPTNASLAALSRVLDEDIVVRDEHRTYEGLTAVRDWRIDTMARTPSRARPTCVEEHGDTVVVTAEVSGNFPGSPVMLDHRFSLRDARITALEIA